MLFSNNSVFVVGQHTPPYMHSSTYGAGRYSPRSNLYWPWYGYRGIGYGYGGWGYGPYWSPYSFPRRGSWPAPYRFWKS